MVCAACTSQPARSSWEGGGDKQELEGPLSIVLKWATCKLDAKYHANMAYINLEPTALGILGNKMPALYVIIFTAPIFLFWYSKWNWKCSYVSYQMSLLQMYRHRDKLDITATYVNTDAIAATSSWQTSLNTYCVEDTRLGTNRRARGALSWA